MNSERLQYISHPLQTYPDSMQEQEQLRDYSLETGRGCTLICTEHPPIYTLGTSASEQDVLTRIVDGEEIALFHTGRGGEVTYHGPGQLVCYVVVNLSDEQDLHKHIWRLEEMVIRTLATFGIVADRDERGIGVWVDGLKVAAAGVRCRKWVAWHGIALNIHPNLNHFKGIIPCGMRDAPVTSMQKLGLEVTRQNVEQEVVKQAGALFADFF